MKGLTEKQIDFISQVINQSNISSAAMKEDLIDHFCCAVEAEMQNGTSFETAYDKAYQHISPDGFDEIQRETIYLLTYKKIKSMRKTLFLSGYLSAIGATTTFFMKLMHYPYAQLVLVITTAILLFVLLPVLFMYLYKKDLAQSFGGKMTYVSGFAGIALLVLALLSKFCGWQPDGLMLFAIFLLFALMVLNFAFFPLLFLKMYRKTT
ncbi:MAG: hypothetical protein LBN27_05655 [Prevotellaceae bacterium]|jgi:hypothetical protein|nr:hypothetical protein [Prevotellaceae bacterium]